jgi:hypothetical protein
MNGYLAGLRTLAILFNLVTQWLKMQEEQCFENRNIVPGKGEGMVNEEKYVMTNVTICTL